MKEARIKKEIERKVRVLRFIDAGSLVGKKNAGDALARLLEAHPQNNLTEGWW